MGSFPAVIVATKPDVFDETSGRLPAVFKATTLMRLQDIFFTLVCGNKTGYFLMKLSDVFKPVSWQQPGTGDQNISS